MQQKIQEWWGKVKSTCGSVWTIDRAWKKWIGWPGKIGLCFWVVVTIGSSAPRMGLLLCMFAAVVMEQLRLVRMLEGKHDRLA